MPLSNRVERLSASHEERGRLLERAFRLLGQHTCCIYVDLTSGNDSTSKTSSRRPMIILSPGLFRHTLLQSARSIGQDAGLNESLFADDFKVTVPDAVRQLTDELPLCASISLRERMNPIYLGVKSTAILWAKSCRDSPLRKLSCARP